MASAHAADRQLVRVLPRHHRFARAKGEVTREARSATITPSDGLRFALRKEPPPIGSSLTRHRGGAERPAVTVRTPAEIERMAGYTVPLADTPVTGLRRRPCVHWRERETRSNPRGFAPARCGSFARCRNRR